MNDDNNNPFLYAEQAETWQRETNRLTALERQLSAVIADNANLRACLKYLSERAGIQHETLVQHNHRLIALETETRHLWQDHVSDGHNDWKENRNEHADERP